MRFVWDERKAASNARRHHVTFDEAASVFDDPLALIQADTAHADRLLIMGESSRARVLFVVYVEIESDEVIRIISARRTTPHERKTYEGT